MDLKLVVIHLTHVWWRLVLTINIQILDIQSKLIIEKVREVMLPGVNISHDFG